MHFRFHVVSAMVGFATLVVAAASCGQAPEPVEQAGSLNPLNGAWSMSKVTPGGGSATTPPSQPGLFIFTEGHYSAVYSLGGEPRSRSAVSFNPIAEEKVAQYDSIIVNAGTYDVSGSTVTFQPQIAKSPELSRVARQMTASCAHAVLCCCRTGLPNKALHPAAAGGTRAAAGERQR